MTSFKAPTPLELAHDFLWRVHAECPARGMIGIFNRSHYEDVVTVRVLGLAPEEVWRRRPQRIVEFERLLTDEGTTVLKCFLHVSAEEQQERFAERVADPTKRWKHNPKDEETARRYAEYTAAYEEALTETSTEHAPWYVIPADRNWVRNHAVATVLVEALRRLDPQYPVLVVELGERAAGVLHIGRGALDVLQSALGAALSIRERLLRLGELPLRPAATLLGPLVDLRLRLFRRRASFGVERFLG